MGEKSMYWWVREMWINVHSLPFHQYWYWGSSAKTQWGLSIITQRHRVRTQEAMALVDMGVCPSDLRLQEWDWFRALLVALKSIAVLVPMTEFGRDTKEGRDTPGRWGRDDVAPSDRWFWLKDSSIALLNFP